ncbi:TSUP family transporter [Thalassotalea sp. 1_MG-2023]|uniref:sulfite exporter TauE/SafE family protein n=1 Tax=Thalassotalea sp. 1_MG-2023 TaxID=3062680 RepID=UPI0026E25068|nr:TSUP family transporter [Thalassotalea sp. 1_MG-2023]MDO6428003.1 TSUP family transporter [Thalassotalea sp. 1_MG-2023]
MEIALEPNLWLMLCGIGFLAGLIDAIAGGGGMLTIPALLTVGLPPHLALGTNKLAASFGSLTASITFYRKKLFNIRFWRVSIIMTAIGAVLGTIVVDYLPVHLLDKALPILIMFTAAYTLFSKNIVYENNQLPDKNRSLKIKQSTQGLVLGFYDGVAGPGTGAFWTATSSALYKINILLSCGLARSTNFVSNLCSLLTFIYLGYVNFLLGVSMGLFIMLGSWVGSHWAIKFGTKFIRPIFITVVIIMSINLAYQAWFNG